MPDAVVLFSPAVDLTGGSASVTLNAARILGIAKECGSITVGKRADLIITDGSPLQTTTQIKGVFVGGQPFTPESRQTRLYEKYRARLTPKE